MEDYCEKHSVAYGNTWCGRCVEEGLAALAPREREAVFAIAALAAEDE